MSAQLMSGAHALASAACNSGGFAHDGGSGTAFAAAQRLSKCSVTPLIRAFIAGALKVSAIEADT